MHIFYVIDFIKLAEIGNYSEAADELYITQSSLSKHIQSLEKTLGLKLFNREFHKISLTEGGKIFLPYAKQFEALFLQASKDLQGLISKDQQNLNLGCMPTMKFYDLLYIIAEFKIKYPEVNINLVEFEHTTEKEISEKLFNREYDMVFSDLMFIKSDRIERIDYCNDHLVAVLFRDHPLAAKATIKLKELADEPMALLDKATTNYYYSCKACEHAGFIPKISFLGSRVENILEYVANNLGLALLMEKFTSLMQNSNSVVREIIPTVERTISLGRVANRTYSPASKLFWDYFLSCTGKQSV